MLPGFVSCVAYFLVINVSATCHFISVSFLSVMMHLRTSVGNVGLDMIGDKEL